MTGTFPQMRLALLGVVVSGVLCLTAFGADIRLSAPDVGLRSVETVDPQGSDRVVVHVDVPARDVQEMWMPSWIVPRQERKWSLSTESAPQSGIPYVAYFNATGTNAFSIGAESLVWDTKIVSKINQEKGVWEVTVTVVAGPGGALRPFAVTLDRRSVEWTEALADWRNSLSVPKGTYPADAWKPVYCSWYAKHAAIDQNWVEQTAAIASELGFKTFILDDGWSYDEAKRVNPETIKTWYRDTGRWNAFSKVKFPNFKAHREKMRAFGLNYVVWVSPYFVGTRSESYLKYGFDKKGEKPFEGNVLADPTDRAFMDAVDEQLVGLMKESDLDGLKIDFLDYIRPSVEKPRGAVSLAYLERLMGKLRAVKPNGLFEFRQSYATPLTAHLATQFRVGDVPFEWLANLLGVAQIRVTMGDGVPIHSDPICWGLAETPDNINRHFLAAMAGVPMLSMDLERMSDEERSIVRRWISFYVKHIERFQREGRWHVDYRNGGVAFLTSVCTDEILVIVNEADSLRRLRPQLCGKKAVVLNLTFETLDLGCGMTVPPADARIGSVR